MKQVHTFDSTGDAYDASQIDLDKGSIMVVESEGVVGLAWTWPVAVTAETGELHGVEKGFETQIIADAGWGHYDIVDAVKEATKRGYPLADWAKEYIV